jgi:ABC-2 type transport system permease protein
MVDFKKLMIIIKREYFTRLRSKAFIITTILIPVGFAALFLVPFLLQSVDSDTEYKIAINDQTGIVYNRLAEIDSDRYINSNNQNVEELRTDIIEERIQGYILFNDSNLESNNNLELIYSGEGGISLVGDIRDDIRTALRDVRLQRAEASDKVIEILESRPELATRKLTKEGREEDANTGFLFFLGYGMAFVIYFAIFGYGGLVMRSVIEEKTNRIIEVMVSSVKPFELLLGKVIGMGALGFTQFLIWVTAGAGILTFLGPIMASFSDESATETAAAASTSVSELPAIDPILGVYFVIFFLFGYLIYSAILAAIGSAVDSETDTQQLMIPVMIPVIIAIIILPRIATDPDSTLAIVSSLIPFFSPILMIARIPITDVPFWQIGLSIAGMAATFIICMWLAAKIYRVGILMYGTKPSFKAMAKWIKQG